MIGSNEAMVWGFQIKGTEWPKPMKPCVCMYMHARRKPQFSIHSSVQLEMGYLLQEIGASQRVSQRAIRATA